MSSKWRIAAGNDRVDEVGYNRVAVEPKDVWSWGCPQLVGKVGLADYTFIWGTCRVFKRDRIGNEKKHEYLVR